MTITSDRVKHRGTPAEPFAQPGAYGRVTRTDPSDEKSRLRITPADRGIPAMAHVMWGEGEGEFPTWERLKDLQFLKKGKP